jgi:hypothetical protein
MILEPVRESDKLICDFHNVFLSGFEEECLPFSFSTVFFIGFEDTSSVESVFSPLGLFSFSQVPEQALLAGR